MIEMLPRESVVLEVLESVRTSPQVAARCAWLRKMGYALALDDVASADEALEPLLPSVEYVKVDMKQIAPEALPGVARHFKVRGVHLLAEKVDTREQVERCLEFGFDFFQGYYFARPEIISGRRLSPSEATLLDLLGLILTDAEQAAIEEALKRDVALSVNLLRLANSAASGLRRGVVSLGSAIMLLGRRRLRRWLQLLLYASEPARNVPTPLMQLAATRGRMMELLAPHALGHGAQDLAFLAGIMSLLDTLLKRPLAEIIALLPVPAELRSALLDRGGRLGAMLVLCEAVEDGDPACVVQAIAGLPGLSAGAVTLAHADALRWANSIGEQAA
jgi:EAL and modified HD-GYP domain-containing signal transduction protein